MKKYKCEICNRLIAKKNRIYGKTVCSKHMHQLFKYGRALDNNPRTTNDLNEFRYLENDIVEFDVYNQKCEVVNHFWIDKDDLNKVRYHKWRIDPDNRIITGNGSKRKPRKELGNLIMDCPSDRKICYLNGDTRLNIKMNLRVCTQAENLCNKHFMSNSQSGEIGIVWDKTRRRWAPEIRKDGKKYHLSRYKTIEEARYARYIGEVVLFGEYRCDKDYDFGALTDERKKEIEDYVKRKISAISYVEVPNMQDNIPAVIAIIQHIYNTILYAELNTKSDYCDVCGFDGEIQIESENDRLFWRCPNCGNTDQTKMHVARRTCGYIGSQYWNQGRTQEIKDRVLHVD